MFKRVIGATVTAVVALTTLTLATAAVAAPATSHAVLTTHKVGGPNVKKGAKLIAVLAKGSTAKFSSTGGHGNVTCRRSNFSDKVTKNPSKPGTAQLSLTHQSFAKCTTTFGGATGVKSVKLSHLPYKTSISDKPGNPVKVSNVSTTITLRTVVGTLSCTYKAKSVNGHASNKTQVISFSKQPFRLSSGSSACPKRGSFSASYGPVTDSSVSGHPHVFVN
jgi:hypothetical protein